MSGDDGKFSLADLLIGASRAYERRVAMSDDQRQLSFREYTECAAQLAHVLRNDGIEPGQHVGIALRDGIDVLVTMLALWLLDAVVVQFDFRGRVDERNRLSTAFDLAGVIEDRSLPGASYRSLPLRECLSRAASRPTEPPEQTTVETHPALISLTSGTTGEPMGMVLSHRALASRFFAYGLEANYPSSTRYLNAFPLSFSASRNHTLANLLRGTEIVFHPPTFGAGEIIERINSLGIGFMFVVPATVRDMLDVVGEAIQPALPSLRMLYSGGSGMPASDKLAAAAKLTPTFSHCFSATTTGTVSILWGDDLRSRPDTEGRVVPWVRAEIVDEAGRALPPGSIGALRVRGPGAIDTVYKGRDRESGDRIRNGWGYTGDLGVIDPEGFLTIKGRTSDMVVRGGANVYPAEVEAAIATLAGVREVAVTGFADDKLGEEVAAFVVADEAVNEAAIIAHCRTQLSPDKRPRRVVFLEALPRNANGKVLKRELRAGLEGETKS